MLDDITPASRAYALRVFLSAFEADGEFELARRHDRLLALRDAETELSPEEGRA